jgi:tetratricopeptide (TPR) repeat protein
LIKPRIFYRKALELSPKNSTASFNLGNALFRDKKAEEAEKIFGLAAENTEDKVGRADAEYNKGVALTQQKKTAESIEAYKDALRLNPTDSMARENLQRALKELQSQQQNNKKNNQQKEKKQQQKLNKQQIQQLLNALQNRKSCCNKNCRSRKYLPRVNRKRTGKTSGRYNMNICICEYSEMRI